MGMLKMAIMGCQYLWHVNNCNNNGLQIFIGVLKNCKNNWLPILMSMLKIAITMGC